MAVVANPYSAHHEKLGVLEEGLKALKNEKVLMSVSEFSELYSAVERHHRDLRLAHLTGKAKDLLEQADRDTKFYNILIKMLCEVRNLPRKQRKETLRKVYNWYTGNKHTLASGPRFGKSSPRQDELPKSESRIICLKSGKASQRSTKSPNPPAKRGSDKENEAKEKDQDFRQMISEARDDISSMHGVGDSTHPPSEPASSRLSMFGNDFLTNRFMMDLPSSKLSWHLDTPMGKSGVDMASVTDWDGPDLELQRIGESSLSQRTFEDHAHRSVPHSSPELSHLGDESPGSFRSAGSSDVDVGSADMMDFHSDTKHGMSHGVNTSTGFYTSGGVNGMSDQSSGAGYGLPKKMIHSIASLVNPHAKMAESEAKRQEREYYQEQRTNTPYRSKSRISSTSLKGPPDLSAHIPVLRAVSVTSNKEDNIRAFNSFRHDHLYGQEILSRLNFVGRSGTALDVRYSAHAHGDQPEQHTRDIIHLYSTLAQNGLKPQAKQSESMIHNQTLEEFYQSSEMYSPSLYPQSRSSSRIQSAPAPRVKSAKGGKDNRTTKTAQARGRVSPAKPRTAQKLGRSLLDKEKPEKEEVEMEDEVLYSADRPVSDVKLETVVTMIDQVKEEMSYFREKLAPTPMPGFRQPASTSVSSKPLSRPTSTASHKSRPRSSQVRPRSPSPEGRPSTPQETDEILMGEPEVPADTLKPVLINRPHSATVNRAVDWRGKVSPEQTKIKSKNRFGGHSYVQKMKPSLRTAGATSAGKRPKTAPISMKERWHSKEKECDKNERVSAQAASNTMTQVDDRDMDRIMSIQHLLGSSDSRYGSMGSLFLDEDFLRSMNSRYATASSMSHLSSGPQNREYLSFVAPKTPKQSAAGDGRSVSKQSIRKPEVDEIAEVLSEKEEEYIPAESHPEVPPLQLQEQEGEEVSEEQVREEPVKPSLDSELSNQETVSEETLESEVKVAEGDDQTQGVTQVKVTEVPKKPQEITRETVHVATEEREDGTHIEVTAVPAQGRPFTAPTESALKVLSESETWHFQPYETEEIDQKVNDSKVKNKLEDSKLFRHQHHYAHHRQDLDSRQSNWAKSIVKPENYCFQCLPESMSTKVGRSAGRMPGGIQSPAGQVLRMARRQNEYFKKTPHLRTPPSIPSTHHMHSSAPSPRQGQQYNAELEHHARRVKSPRHFMEQEIPRRSRPVDSGRLIRGSPLVELRKDNCRSAPPGSRQDAEDIMDSLSVVSLRTASRAHTAPSFHSQTSDTLSSLPTHAEEEDQLQGEGSTGTATPEVIYSKPTAATKPRPVAQQQSLANIGRPIPQVSHVPDPDDVLEAVAKQKEAKAAVDIQRIFRGYVCRTSYLKLLWENRKAMEDKQMALQESQREYRKHLDRKNKIYNRPPLDPTLLQWAKDFKQIQTENEEIRQIKADAMAKEMLANQQKAKSKIEVIGPHVEIYDIYHPKDTGPSKRDMYKAAVCIQKYVRGFLVRKRFEKLRRKATFCGTTWKKIVKDYKNLLIRVQRWHGVEKPTTPFSLQDMHEYMDLRRRYESQFDKKAFGSELELSELEAFFRECDLYPSRMEIDEGLDVTTQGQSLKKGNGLKKHEAMNLLFYIYTPKATGLKNTRQSTWMNPIIDGVEARKLIGGEFVENAPLKPCADIVINSRRERKMKEDAEREEREELERKRKGEKKEDDSDSDGKSRTAVESKTGLTGKGAVKNKQGIGVKKK